MTVPFGLSVAGCSKGTTVRYCEGFTNSGPVAGQAYKITLDSALATTGLSLNYGQYSGALTASTVDCYGTAVTVSSYTYATSSMQYADINPSTGSVCAGQWNRNSGGGIADYTTCTADTTVPANFVAYVTATTNGVTSNAIPVYVHPVIGSVVLGSNSTSCTTDLATNCCTNTSTSATTVVSAAAYSQTSCLSQYATAQFFARVYDTSGNNITCQVGHVGYSLTTSAVGTIDENGVVTAALPGSSLITATVANSSTGSDVGYYSTCPPTSIVLTANNSTGSAITVSTNNTESFTTTVMDKNGTTLSGLSLEFESTSPRIAPATSSGTVTPAYPGVVDITAQCQPSTCNPSPFSRINYLGNGVGLISNGITVTSTGTASQVLYMASTDSVYIASYDFVTGAAGSAIKLPYVPNSLVISQDGSTMYAGSSTALMTVSTASNSVTATNTALPGDVIAISPDGSTLVVTDPTRNTTSLVSSAGTVTTTYGGVATHAEWTPDSLLVYITTTANTLLTYSSVQGWQTATTGQVYTDVAVTVPSFGAYFAGTVTDGRSTCPYSTINTVSGVTSVTNTFSPLVDQVAAQTDRLAATTDGVHLIGATAGSGTTAASIQDIRPAFPTQSVNGTTVPASCPLPGSGEPTTGYYTHTTNSLALSGVTPSSITGVTPATNTSTVAVTYQGSGGKLPLYVPVTTGAGTLRYVTLSGSATAPVAGAYSTDNGTFYAGTTGDNLVHVITISNGVGTDASTINPLLTSSTSSSTYAVPNLIVQRPLKTTAQ